MEVYDTNNWGTNFEVPVGGDLLSNEIFEYTSLVVMAAEDDTAGFNLYRASTVDGPYSKINPGLILAEGDVVSGASYTYIDTNVVKGNTYYYKLEDVDFNGISTFHGLCGLLHQGLGSTCRFS